MELNLDGLNANDFGDLLFQDPLDPVCQRELRHRATAACALKLNLHNSFVSNVNQRYVAAVGLESRSNLIEHRLNSCLVHSDPPQR